MIGGNLTDPFKQRIKKLHTRLSIPATYIDSCRMPLQFEETKLCDAGLDVFGRQQRMSARTLEQWELMKKAALTDGIELLLVSAFRGIDYQCELISNKLSKGQQIEEILKVNAAPGFSEHHTGCALDLTIADIEPLTEDFETTDAFGWLESNAAKFHFFLSFPRDNPFGIAYEPWHWACRT